MKFSDQLTKLIPKDFGARSNLARKVGVTVNYIVDVAAGRRKAPTLLRCRQISDGLNLSKAESDQLIRAALRERFSKEELEVLEEVMAGGVVKENIGKAYEWSNIRGSSACPRCNGDLDVEVDRNGNVTLSGRVTAKVRRV